MKVSYEKLKDPGFYKENRLPAHADFVAYENLQDMREDKRTLYASLNGVWKISYAENYAAAPDGYEREDVDCSAWEEIHVPGHIQLQGYDRPQYVNTQYPWDGLEEIAPGELPERFNPTACYVKYFELPAPRQGRPVYISFQGAESCVILYLNGHYVGYGADSFTPSDFELTPYIKAGVNKLAVTVVKWTAGSWCEDQDFFRFSGIYRDVFLYTRPDAYIEDYTVRTELADDFADSEVRVSVKGNFASVDAQIFDGEKLLAETELSAISDTADEKTVCGAVDFLSVKNPRLWSAEDPYLYTLLLTVKDEDGSVCEVIPQKVGICRIEIRDCLILLNGKRLEFKGVNRHDFSSSYGRAVTREETLLDVTTMKRNNINAIRTSHYPDNCALYHLCDQYGLYMIAENNMESHGSWVPDASVVVPGDKEEWLPMMLDRVRSCYERDKNHPAVLIWSCGNESYGGKVIYEMAREFKRLDPSRPVHYEGIFQDRRYNVTSDIESQMYPSVASIEKFLSEHRDKPFICCEYTHAMGNSCGGMSLYTDLMEREPLYQGGFIWDYIDQSITKKNRYGEEFQAYGGDFDDRPSDYDFSGNGIVYGGDRSPSPKMQSVKYNYQNIKITMEQGKKPATALIRNRNLFVSTGCYDCMMAVRKNGRTFYETRLDVDVAPMTEKELALALPELSGAGEYTVTLSFWLREDTLWAKAGHEVAFGECSFVEESMQMANRLFFHQELAGCASEKTLKPQVMRGRLNLGVRGERFTALFSYQKGGLVSYVYDGREMLQSIPRADIFRAPTSNDCGNQMPQRYAQWKIASEYNTYLAFDGDPERTGREMALPQTTETDNSVRISFTYYMPTVPRSQCRISYEVFADGTVCVTLDYDPVRELGDMPAFGVLFKMKADYDRLEWYGLGPEETYSDRTQGAKLGIYHNRVQDNLAKYLVPQECGNKTGVRYAKVTDENGHGLLFTGDGMSFSALPYTPQELEAAAHAYELPPVHYTVIRAALAQMGIAGDDSWGARTLDQFLLDVSEPVSFTFPMRSN